MSKKVQSEFSSSLLVRHQLLHRRVIVWVMLITICSAQFARLKSPDSYTNVFNAIMISLCADDATRPANIPNTSSYVSLEIRYLNFTLIYLFLMIHHINN